MRAYHESLLNAKVIMDDFGQGGQAVGGAGGIAIKTKRHGYDSQIPAGVVISPLIWRNTEVRYLTMVMLEGSYLSSLTPMTNMGASGEGADTTTR